PAVVSDGADESSSLLPQPTRMRAATRPATRNEGRRFMSIDLLGGWTRGCSRLHHHGVRGWRGPKWDTVRASWRPSPDPRVKFRYGVPTRSRQKPRRRSMTTTEPSRDQVSDDEILDELRDWLRDTWDPDLTVAAWWEKLGLEGWA